MGDSIPINSLSPHIDFVLAKELNKDINKFSQLKNRVIQSAYNEQKKRAK
jgi:hypothetical protein